MLKAERLNCWFAFRDFRISDHIRGHIREYRHLSVVFGDMSDVKNSAHFGSLFVWISSSVPGVSEGTPVFRQVSMIL